MYCNWIGQLSCLNQTKAGKATKISLSTWSVLTLRAIYANKNLQRRLNSVELECILKVRSLASTSNRKDDAFGLTQMKVLRSSEVALVKSKTSTSMRKRRPFG